MFQGQECSPQGIFLLTHSRFHKARQKHNLDIPAQHFPARRTLTYAPVQVSSKCHLTGGQRQQITPQACPKSWAMINWAPQTHSSHSAPTAAHPPLPSRKSCQLGQLQLKTGAWSSSTNHREKTFEERLQGVFSAFCDLGMKPEKLEGKSAAVRGKGSLLLLFYFKHMY